MNFYEISKLSKKQQREYFENYITSKLYEESGTPPSQFSVRMRDIVYSFVESQMATMALLKSKDTNIPY